MTDVEQLTTDNIKHVLLVSRNNWTLGGKCYISGFFNMGSSPTI